MHDTLLTPVRSLLSALLIALAMNAPEALAQQSGSDPRNLLGSYASPYARYYAPYALQAAAAYVSVASLDGTLVGEFKRPPIDSSDAELAVAIYPRDPANPDLTDRARKYLRVWQYQFGSQGYLRCFENDPDCNNALRATPPGYAISAGPTFHVWARTRYPQKEGVSCSEVSIAFRGTELAADWFGNFNPVTSYFYDDHYSQLKRNIDLIIKKITGLDCYRRAPRLAKPQIVSVGHSLGGGLAQFAALANNPGRPRIAKVFAFDPSPVTGASLVDKSILSQNSQGLDVDRIYQRGEALHYVRRGIDWIGGRSSSCSPQMRDVGFDAISGNAIRLHGMSGLARELVTLSYYPSGDQNTYFPPPSANCGTRLYVPQRDDELSPAPAEQQPQTSRAPGGSAMALARTDRDRMIDRDVRANMFGTAYLVTAGENGAIEAKPARLATNKSVRLSRGHKARAVRMARH